MDRMSIKEFAQATGKHENTIRNRIRKGELKFPLTQEKADNYKDAMQGRPARR